MNPKTTSNQSSKPCTVLHYPSRKASTYSCVRSRVLSRTHKYILATVHRAPWYTHIHTYIHTHAHTHIHAHMYTHVRARFLEYTNMHWLLCIMESTCIVCMCVCVHVERECLDSMIIQTCDAGLHSRRRYNALQHTATLHCNTLQHCNTL